jgi:tetratricopeptide (TPR) repeat protein
MKSMLITFFIVFPTFLLAQDYSEINNLVKQNNYKEAESFLSEKLRANADDDSAHYFSGMIFLQKEKFDEAIKSFEKCVTLKPQIGLYHLRLGQVLGRSAQKGGVFAQIGSVGRIKGSFEKAVELDPKNFESRYMLSVFHLQAPGIVGGNQEIAKQQAKEYERFNSNKAGIIWAAYYGTIKDDDKFLEIFLKTNPVTEEELRDFYKEVFFNKMQTILIDFIEKKNYENAEKISVKFIEAFPASYIGHWAFGRCLTEKKQYDEAIIQFEKGINLEKKYFGGYYRIGIAYQLKGDTLKAIEYLEKFLAMETKVTDATKDAKAKLEELKR